jgi:hypothetical protein
MSAQPAVRRTPLRLIESDAHESAWFCGHCGERPGDESPMPMPRVCSDCGLGLLLQTRADAAPERDEAFVVVDSSLNVQAVSARAEVALDVKEAHVVNRHVTELLIPGETESASGSLAVAITRAAGGGDELERRFAVRPSHTFGVRMLARIAACGPVPAALLVLDAPGRA